MNRKKDHDALPKGGGVDLTAEELPFVAHGLPAVMSGVTEVSVLLRLPHQWVKDMAECGAMPCVRIGGVLNFSTGLLMKWLFREFPNRVDGNLVRRRQKTAKAGPTTESGVDATAAGGAGA